MNLINAFINKALHLFAFAILFSFSSLANNSPDKEADLYEEEIYSVFNRICAAEELIGLNDTIDLSAIKEMYPSIKFEETNFLSLPPLENNKDLFLPPFYLGCFFGPLGIILTALISEWDDTKIFESLLGMGTGCMVELSVFTLGVIIGYGYIIWAFFQIRWI